VNQGNRRKCIQKRVRSKGDNVRLVVGEDVGIVLVMGSMEKTKRFVGRIVSADALFIWMEYECFEILRCIPIYHILVHGSLTFELHNKEDVKNILANKWYREVFYMG
jgi:hypothetical protein